MATYSLSIYRITVNRRNEPDKLLPLDCLDNDVDLLSVIDGMLTRWHSDRYHHSTSQYNGPLRDRRVARIRQNTDGSFSHHRLGRYISGIVESGSYGTEESIINTDSGEVRHRKQKDEAQMVPFYFCFHIPANSKSGYLVLERIGNNGIFTMMSEAIGQEVMCKVSYRSVIKTEPFVIDDILNNNISSIINPRKVFLRGVKHSAFSGGLPLETLAGNSVSAEIVLSVSPQHTSPIRSLLLDLIGRYRKRQPLVVDNIECSDVAFQVKIGNKTRKVSVARLDMLGTCMDVTYKVEIENDGYPSYESLHREACRLLSM